MYRRELRDADLDDLLRDLATVDGAVQAVPGPDGDRVACAVAREDRTDLWLVDDGGPRRLTGGGVTAQRYGRHDPGWFDWHPDGSAVVYTTEDGDLRQVDVDAGGKTRLTSHDATDTQPRYDPAGEAVAVVTELWSPGSLGLVAADGDRLTCLRDDEFHYQDPQWTPDGEAVYAVRSRHRDLGDYQAELVRVSRGGSLARVFAEEGVRAETPRPRPGSGEVAFAHDGTGFDAVYVTESGTGAGDGAEPGSGGGAEPELLHAEDGGEVVPHDWDADGDRLAVSVTREGSVDLKTVTRDGDVEAVAADRALRYAPAWRGDALVSVTSRPTRPPAVVDETAGETLAAAAPVGFDDRLVAPEPTTYEADDGLEIHALVYRPPGFEDAGEDEVPLLVNPHGGPTSYDGYGFAYRAQYFAALGYAVVQPNYRGSDGFGRRFRNRNDHAWGEGDLADVVAAADATADASPAVDGDRVGVFGGSGGGLMTVNALGRTDRFDAGAAFFGVYDYETFVDDTDDVGWRLLKRELGFPATDIESYREESPIRYAADVEAPLLLLHGEDDVRVPLSQSEQLAAALDRHGKPHELHSYEGEPHGFTRRETVVDAYTRVADLFAKYLVVDPDDGSSRPHPPE